MLLEIGNIYEFNYESSSKRKSKPKKEPIKIQLKEQAANKIVSYYKENKDRLQEKFDLRTIELKSYLDLVDEKEEMAKIRGRKRRTQEEIDLDEKIASMKAELFAKVERVYTEEERARNKFFKNYTIKNIDLDAEEKPFRALYIGDKYTNTGKVVNNFISLKPVTIEKESLEPELAMFVDIA